MNSLLLFKKIYFNAVSCLHLRLSRRSRLPGAFQKFTKFYQFCSGYLSSLGVPPLLSHLRRSLNICEAGPEPAVVSPILDSL